MRRDIQNVQHHKVTKSTYFYSDNNLELFMSLRLCARIIKDSDSKEDFSLVMVIAFTS